MSWIEWTRTTLRPEEARRLLQEMDSSEAEALCRDGFAWSPGRIVWRTKDGQLRRARFTHGAHFETAAGCHYVTSSGTVRRISEAGGSPAACGDESALHISPKPRFERIARRCSPSHSGMLFLV